MYYAHYDSEGKIKGVYDSEVHSVIPQPYLEVDESTRTKIILRPERFTIINGIVTDTGVPSGINRSVVKAAKKQSIKREIAGPIEVDGREYLFNENLQRNIVMGLSICQHDPEYKVRIWCKSPEWEFRSHSKDELVAIAKAFNDRRESKSESLHSLI